MLKEKILNTLTDPKFTYEIIFLGITLGLSIINWYIYQAVFNYFL